MLMQFFHPVMIRALGQLFSFKSRASVHIYFLPYRKGGKMLLLFKEPLSRETQIDVLADLADMGDLVKGSLSVSTHTVSVEWRPLVDSAVGATYVTGEIQFTVLMTVLGTYQPRMERWHMSITEAASHINELSRRHEIDWAGELMMRSS